MTPRVLGWLLTLPLTALAVIFAVANRHDVRLDLWPLPWTLHLPAYLAVLAPLVLGMALGGLALWLSGFSARRQAAEQRRRADSLERQLDAARLIPVKTAGSGDSGAA